MSKFNFKNIDARKFLGTIIGGIFFISCILFFTYAYYQWESSKNIVSFNIEELSGNTGQCIIGPSVNVSDIGPVLNVQDGVGAEFVVRNDTDTDMSVTLHLNIESISSNLLVESFKYALVGDPDGGSDYNYDSFEEEGDFSNFILGNNLISTNLVVDSGQVFSYKFIVYIDGSMYNDNNMMQNSMVASLEFGDCGAVQYEELVNRPNLDNGNLIPVYYDDVDEVWRKADSSNKNYSWYDYENKEWANAVMVDTSKKSTYQSVDVGAAITDSDIIAFYVWIPRYKYRVWNITRQGGTEDTYAYSAYSKGIEIEFESGTESTGNVECIYDVNSSESTSNLSDKCYYKGSSTSVAKADSNSSYTDAWYTHPAFTFGDKDLEGFWIGKFETSAAKTSACYTSPSLNNCNNINQNPRIISNVASLRYQSVSNQFMTAVKFQDYLSNNISAHMLTNLEWGAVAYLTHSKYGLCDESSCEGLYHNNSSGYYTGRSGGDIAGSSKLNLSAVYSGQSSTDKHNTNGYYTYDGYLIDSNGNITTTKDITKVASTTRNITGVYDLSGGTREYVMGNKVSYSSAFYPSSAGTSWNGTKWYDTANSSLYSKYYNSYSYGMNYNDISAFNRARLGDATSEVLGSNSGNSSAWQPGIGTTGAVTSFVNSVYSWVGRGGYYYNYSGLFNFDAGTGEGSSDIISSFRVSIS